VTFVPASTEAGLSLFGVLKQADPALVDPGVTAQLVVDADLADYFGSIPHAELLKSVAARKPTPIDLIGRQSRDILAIQSHCPGCRCKAAAD
jgi:hypothetical protein